MHSQQTNASTCCRCMEHVDTHNHSTPQQGCLLWRTEKMSSSSLYTCSQHIPGQSVCFLQQSYIWMTKLVCAPPIQSPISLSGSITAIFSSFSAYSLSASSLTCRDTIGFLQTFRFSLFVSWWGDTRHAVESSCPGGILIDQTLESVSERNRERWRQGETKMRSAKRLSSNEIKWRGL